MSVKFCVEFEVIEGQEIMVNAMIDRMVALLNDPSHRCPGFKRPVLNYVKVDNHSQESDSSTHESDIDR